MNSSPAEFIAPPEAPATQQKQKWQWVWPVVLAAAIFFQSGHKQIAGPNIVDFDKVMHFGVFGLLATLVCRLGKGWRAALLALVLTSAFGATDEWHQSFVPERSSDIADWVADTLGAALAVSVYTGWPWYRHLLERKWGRKRRVEKEVSNKRS